MRAERYKLLLAIACFFIAAWVLARAAYGARVIASQISPDGLWRVEIADHSSHSKFELWSTPTAGGPRRKIGTAVAHDFDVFEALISADSLRVVYRYGRTATGESHLYSTPIDKLQGVRISPPPAEGGRVGPGIAHEWGGQFVRYPYAELAGGPESPRIVSVAGGHSWRELFADGFEGGGTGAWR